MWARLAETDPLLVLVALLALTVFAFAASALIDGDL